LIILGELPLINQVLHVLGYDTVGNLYLNASFVILVGAFMIPAAQLFQVNDAAWLVYLSGLWFLFL
jgi:hypothetical protein